MQNELAMKSVLDKSTRDELFNRINSLNENSKPLWGKMNVFQMLRHCTLCEEMFQGEKKHKRAFIGRIFGRVALKGILKDEKPFKKNSPTNPVFKPSENKGDINAEKAKWISQLEAYAGYSKQDFEHWFFGKMTREQVGVFDYKHIDHHLRQFNA